MDVGLALTVCFLMVSMSAVQSQIQKGPVNSLKVTGDNITLECVTVNKNCDQVDWAKVEGLQSPKLVYRNGQGMLNNDVYPPQRYSVNSTGGCSLTVTRLEINDSGRFICIHSVDSGEKTRSSILVVITVQSHIETGPTNAVKKVGDSVTLECTIVNNNCDQVDWQKVEGQNPPKRVYRHGSGMVNNDLYPTERYSVNERRGCSLTITQLHISDSGRFSCVLAANGTEETRTFILVVINVTESRESNVTSNSLNKDDEYSLECTINIPAKSVEPSDVTLVFQNKTANEKTETTNGTQPLSVKTTLTGVATKENITRVCSVSFPPSTKANYDRTTAVLDVCPMQLIVSYPVENINVALLSGKDGTVRCTADGHPPPTFKWTIGKSGDVVDGDTLVITDPRDNYTCTATNTFKGTSVSRNVLYEVSVPPPPGDCGSGCMVGVIICTFICCCLIWGVTYAGWKYKWSPQFVWLYSRKEKKNGGRNSDKADVPLNDYKCSGPPTSNYTPNSEAV